jgi:hypothetical protein
MNSLEHETNGRAPSGGSARTVQEVAALSVLFDEAVNVVVLSRAPLAVGERRVASPGHDARSTVSGFTCGRGH